MTCLVFQCLPSLMLLDVLLYSSCLLLLLLLSPCCLSLCVCACARLRICVRNSGIRWLELTREWAKPCVAATQSLRFKVCGKAGSRRGVRETHGEGTDQQKKRDMKWNEMTSVLVDNISCPRAVPWRALLTVWRVCVCVCRVGVFHSSCW